MFLMQIAWVIDWFKLNLTLWNEKWTLKNHNNICYRYTDFRINWTIVSCFKAIGFKCTRAHSFAFVDQNWFIALNTLLTHFDRKPQNEFCFCLWWLQHRHESAFGSVKRSCSTNFRRQIWCCVCFEGRLCVCLCVVATNKCVNTLLLIDIFSFKN